MDSLVSDRKVPAAAAAERLFAGTGEIRALCRMMDWSAPPLGPVADWPQSLRTAFDLCLGSSFPSAVCWGPARILLYNDAAIALLGARHPAALGAPAAEGWRGLLWGEDASTAGAPSPDDQGTRSFIVSYAALHDEAGAVAGVHAVGVERTGAPAGPRPASSETDRDALRRQLVAAEEDERRRLARELHDQLGQHLTALALGLAEARRLLRTGGSPDARLRQLEELVSIVTRDARHLAIELRPPELDDVGFESAVETFVEQWSARFGVPADVAVTGVAAERLVPVDAATALYRIMQEALTNVAKHAEATQVSVLVDKPDGEVRLLVEDDGRGFDVDAALRRTRREHRLGLASMRERAALARGTLQVESSPGGGTTVYARVPMEG